MFSKLFQPILGIIFVTAIVSAVSIQPIQCLAQEVEKKIEIRFVDSKNNLIENVRAYRYENGKAKVISATAGIGSFPPGEGLVAARKDGFQFSGALLTPDATNLTVVMLRPKEIGPKYTTLPLPISEETKKKVIGSLEESFWATLNANPKDQNNVRICMQVLSSLNPEKSLEFIEANPLPGQMNYMVKNEIIKAFANSNFETAIELTNSIEDPMSRSMVLSTILKSADVDPQMLEAVETEMTDTIKSIFQPMYRYAAWSVLAEHYLNSDRPKLAQKVIDEHIEDVKALPAGGWSGFPRSLFAALVVEKDPKLAAELVKGMDKREYDRALGRLAFHCCRTNPEKAIEFLNSKKSVKNAITDSEHHIQVCERMAVEQTDAALELAASIDEPNQKGWAFGLIADRLHATNPARAKQALNKAADALKDCTAEDDSWFSSAGTTAGLLPIAEKVAPEKMNSLIWQSIYLSLPRSRWNVGGGSKTLTTQSAAAAIARYDQKIAKALLGDKKIEIGGDVSRSATNQVALDANGLPEFLKRLDKVNHSGAFQPRQVAVGLLRSDKARFWKTVSKPSFLNWPTRNFEEH